MPRIVVRLAFVVLAAMLTASLVSLVRSDMTQAANETPYLLSLPDLSSPRATLDTLMSNGDTAFRDVMAGGVPWQPSAAMLRMMDTVNVADVASANRDLEAALAASQLDDVLNHLTARRVSDFNVAWLFLGLVIGLINTFSGSVVGTRAIHLGMTFMLGKNAD